MKKLRRFDPGQEGMRVGDVWINARSRDDIPKLLGGLRDVYLNVELREAVFLLLEKRIGGCGNRDAVGPGVSLWTIFVLGMLKRRLGCDFDRLHEHANTHLVLRQLLGHGEYDPVEYSYDTVLRDISLLDEYDTLRVFLRHGAAGYFVTGRGHAASDQGPGGTVRNPVVPGLNGAFPGLRRHYERKTPLNSSNALNLCNI